MQSVEEDGLYGTVVTVDHGDGTQAVYANLASIPAVNPGDWIFGDIDGDARADATDANLALAYYGDMLTLNTYATRAADLTVMAA